MIQMRKKDKYSRKQKNIENVWSNKLLIISGILIIILISFLIFNRWNTIQQKEITTTFIISEKMGFDLNNSALTFGMFPPGSTANRDIEIKNNFDCKVFVSIYSSKNIINFIRISENDFYLNPGENKLVSFSLDTDKDSVLGAYNGFIKIIIKKTGVF